MLCDNMHYQREVQFSSFEEFDSFPHGWDTDFSTTSTDTYSAALRQTIAPGLLVNTAVLSSPTLQRGTTPSGMRTFALPAKLPTPYSWRGLPVSDNTLIIFPEDRELFSTMGANVEMMTIAIDQALVDSCIENWELDTTVVFGSPSTTDLCPSQYNRVRSNLSLLTEFMVKYGDHQQFKDVSRGVQEYMIDELLKPVASSLCNGTVSRSFAAQRVKAASDYILAHVTEPLTVAEVCTAIGSSRRSLEQCFQKYAGTSPKQFIQLLRFNQCRAALLGATTDSRISDIAGRYGFWHMGQFGATYRRLFAETPRNTLQRSLH
jgi:AraC family ethanolamine operon transcriptional activator